MHTVRYNWSCMAVDCGAVDEVPVYIQILHLRFCKASYTFFQAAGDQLPTACMCLTVQCYPDRQLLGSSCLDVWIFFPLQIYQLS